MTVFYFFSGTSGLPYIPPVVLCRNPRLSLCEETLRKVKVHFLMSGAGSRALLVFRGLDTAAQTHGELSERRCG